GSALGLLHIALRWSSGRRSARIDKRSWRLLWSARCVRLRRGSRLSAGGAAAHSVNCTTGMGQNSPLQSALLRHGAPSSIGAEVTRFVSDSFVCVVTSTRGGGVTATTTFLYI